MACNEELSSSKAFHSQLLWWSEELSDAGKQGAHSATVPPVFYSNEFIKHVLFEVIPLAYALHRCLLHVLGPLLTFFPTTLDYSIMLKAGRSCLFILLYPCTCCYHAVTKYMAIGHSSLCNWSKKSSQSIVFS